MGEKKKKKKVKWVKASVTAALIAKVDSCFPENESGQIYQEREQYIADPLHNCRKLEYIPLQYHSLYIGAV